MKQYTNREWLKVMYTDKELSIQSIAKICNVSLVCIHKYLVKFKIPRRKFCGRSGVLSGAYKDGHTISKSGYIWILSHGHPNAMKGTHAPYVPEQILVAEKIIGRYLTKKEIIHHINEIKSDNRPENLYLFSSTHEHSRYHQKLRKGTIEPITKSNLSMNE
jgi:hypothetical protein